MPTRHHNPVNLLVHPCLTTSGALFTVEGEIDIDSAPLLRGSLVRCLLDGCSVIDVDLAGVTFCDSSGLHVFLDISKAAAQTGGRLRLHNPSPTVARLFTLTGTGTILLAAPVPAAPTPAAEPPAAATGPLNSVPGKAVAFAGTTVGPPQPDGPVSRLRALPRGDRLREALLGNSRVPLGSALTSQANRASREVIQSPSW